MYQSVQQIRLPIQAPSIVTQSQSQSQSATLISMLAGYVITNCG
jgi:hypothetical protein